MDGQGEYRVYGGKFFMVNACILYSIHQGSKIVSTTAPAVDLCVHVTDFMYRGRAMDTIDTLY